MISAGHIIFGIIFATVILLAGLFGGVRGAVIAIGIIYGILFLLSVPMFMNNVEKRLNEISNYLKEKDKRDKEKEIFRTDALKVISGELKVDKPEILRVIRVLENNPMQDALIVEKLKKIYRSKLRKGDPSLNVRCPFCNALLGYSGDLWRPYACICGAEGKWKVEGKSVEFSLGNESRCINLSGEAVSETKE